MTDAVVSIKDIHKKYGGFGRKVHALRGVSMDVPRGSIFGLLGPNGAGKSTLVKILITAVKRSSGTGTVLGKPIGRKDTLAKVGYLPEHHNLPKHLTGRQVIEFFGAMTMMPKASRRSRADELLDLVHMRDWHDKKVGGYSKGMRQRIGIAQALVADPDLIILDEPTDGVDPSGRRDIRLVLQQMRDEGRTVFINSHLLGELEQVCDSVAIMHKGQVVSMGTIDELTEGMLRYEIEIEGELEAAGAMFGRALPETLGKGESTGAPPTTGLAPPTREGLAKRVGMRGELATGESVEVHGNRLWIGTTDAGTIQPVLDAIRAKGGVIKEVRTHRPSLEDLFMQAVEHDDSPGAARGATPTKRSSGGEVTP
ncbi:MAG: ATP-binding cassette domain-containing protein [Phycisphaerales bacterium]|nr:ATP-binding cassette domain-containing protein [Phycisphaerales bacterium]